MSVFWQCLSVVGCLKYGVIHSAVTVDMLVPLSLFSTVRWLTLQHLSSPRCLWRRSFW